MRRLEADNVLGAARRLRELAAPGACASCRGRPCQEACRRGEIDEALPIAELLSGLDSRGRRDRATRAGPRETAPVSGRDAVVIGGGIVGLTCAAYLANSGVFVRGINVKKAARPGGSGRDGGEGPRFSARPLAPRGSHYLPFRPGNSQCGRASLNPPVPRSHKTLPLQHDEDATASSRLL